MKISTARVWHGILGGASLLTYLCFPIVSLGGKIELSGADIFDMANRFGNNNFWIYLFVFFPVMAIIVSLIPQTKKKNLVYSAIGMFIPVVFLFAELERGIQVGGGLVFYILLSIVMLICASVSGEEEDNEENLYRSQPEEHWKEEPDPRQQEMAQQFDDEKLAEIVDNAQLYNAQLVEASQKEIALRKEAEALRPIAEQKSDEELMEIIQSAPGMYNPAMVYCSNDVMAERAARRKEEEKRLHEEERQRQKQEAEETRVQAEQERLAKQMENERIWKKYRWYLLLVTILLAALGVYCYWQSDTHRYWQGYDHQNNSRPDKAIEYYAMLSNPNSSHYCEAKYRLAKLYMEKKEYDKAAQAWEQSVVTGKWEYPQAYRDYAELRIIGWMVPQLPKNKIIAANIYKNSPDVDEQLKAGALYFEGGAYHDAYTLFNQYSDLSTSKGYIGIMYLYGKAGLAKSAETAWKYLKNAPETEPFLVHKGDLALYFSEYGVLNKINEAKELYRKAMEQNPEREDYAFRYNVLNQLTKAKDRNKHIDYWNRGTVYWDHYSFPDGSYSGEVTNRDNSKGAHGWGAFQFKNKEISIGHFQWLKNSGECLKILPANNGIYIEVGTFRNDKLAKGFTIDTDGFISKTGM